MRHDIIFPMLFLGCILLSMIPGFAAIYIDEKESRKRGQPSRELPMYDERQKQARLRACASALFALIVYLALWAVLDLVGGWAWTKDLVSLSVSGAGLAGMVWYIDCTLHDAVEGWNKRRGFVQVILGPLLLWFNAFWKGEGAPVVWIVSMTGALIWGIVSLYANRRNKRRVLEIDEVEKS